MEENRVRAALLEWFATNGRRIPARETADPWRILVLEVMSQQTQIERASAASEAFLALFPTPSALAAASPADAIRAWSGLGYNRRAIALWRAANEVVERHGGEVPREVEALDALPGIGPYTARAIAVHAFGRTVAPIDVNVASVVGRLIGSNAPQEVQRAADSLLDPVDPSRTVHALMDLSNAICRRRQAACDACPLAFGCASAFRVAYSRSERQTPPFRQTRRWLRGALLRELVSAPDGAWQDFAGRPVGTHPPHAVRDALCELAADGLVELDPSGRARLLGAGTDG